MDMLFLLLSLIVVVGGFVALGRRRKGAAWESRLEEEPWALSLRDEELGDDEPVDDDEIRAAEDAFLQEDGWEPEEDGWEPGGRDF
ncbi:hypothetical protein BH23GEM11_BH23GEM11_03290 [soil metagenome]